MNAMISDSLCRLEHQSTCDFWSLTIKPSHLFVVVFFLCASEEKSGFKSMVSMRDHIVAAFRQWMHNFVEKMGNFFQYFFLSLLRSNLNSLLFFASLSPVQFTSWTHYIRLKTNLDKHSKMLKLWLFFSMLTEWNVVHTLSKATYFYAMPAIDWFNWNDCVM